MVTNYCNFIVPPANKFKLLVTSDNLYIFVVTTTTYYQVLTKTNVGLKVHNLRSDIYRPTLIHQLPSLVSNTHNLISFEKIQCTHHTSIQVIAIEPLSHDSRPPGTHHWWVGRDSMEWEVSPTHLHMTSSGNRTPDLLILMSKAL